MFFAVYIAEISVIPIHCVIWCFVHRCISYTVKILRFMFAFQSNLVIMILARMEESVKWWAQVTNAHVSIIIQEETAKVKYWLCLSSYTCKNALVATGGTNLFTSYIYTACGNKFKTSNM